MNIFVFVVQIDNCINFVRKILISCFVLMRTCSAWEFRYKKRSDFPKTTRKLMIELGQYSSNSYFIYFEHIIE